MTCLLSSGEGALPSGYTESSSALISLPTSQRSLSGMLKEDAYFFAEIELFILEPNTEEILTC